MIARVGPRSHTRAMSSTRVLVLVFATLGLLFSAASLLALETDDHATGLEFAVFGCTFILSSIFASDYARHGNALSPLCTSTVMLFFLFPLHAWFTRDSQTLTVLIGSDADLWRARAILVATVSAPFLLLGYRSRFLSRLADRFRSPGWVLDDLAPSTRTRMFIVYGVGFLPRLIAFASGQGFHWDYPQKQLMEFQFLLSILTNLPLLACAWFVVMGLRTKRRELLVIGLAMLGMELLWSFTSGSRMRVITPLMVVAVAIGHTVTRVTVARVAVILAIFILVLLPFVTAFKASYFERMESIQREGVSSGTVLDSISDATRSDLSLAKGDGPFDLIAERFHGATSLALIIRYTPERHDYYYGVPYLMVVPQVLIPRFLWPGKPAINPFGDVFRYEYWERDRNDDTAIGISQLGDLWVNLHIVGCMLGSLLFGAMIAFVSRHIRYGLAAGSLYPTLVFALHMPMLMHAHENNFDGVLAGLPKSLLVYFALAWLLSRRKSQGGPVVGA
jgi:hypothetical protein